MNRVQDDLSFVDLEFQGRPGVIATAVLTGRDGVALIDPGPTTCLARLTQGLQAAGISFRDVRAVLITHIHLDHAGATGAILAGHPDIKVYVHSRGAPHMVHPAKLIASASRLYGDQMETLWGEIRPVPSDALVVLEGGESIVAAGHRLQVEYTPGHASHHVSYFSDAGVAFVGDAGGIRLAGSRSVVPPTPPPDIDLSAWHASLDTIEQHQCDTIFVTHFGPHRAVREHLEEMRARLEQIAALARTSLARDDTDAGREAWFVDRVREDLRERENDGIAVLQEAAGRFDLSWRGLARYYRRS